MEAGSTSETAVNFYQITRCNNPEDSHLHKQRVFEYRMLRRKPGPKRQELNGGWNTLCKRFIISLLFTTSK
jgi:hypothetical protein